MRWGSPTLPRMHKKARTIKDSANYIHEIVTGPDEIAIVDAHSRPRDRAAVQIEASHPRSSVSFGGFLDELIEDMATKGEPPTAALALAGRAVRGTPWSGYRNGRNRLATLAATYLHWLRPDETWNFAGSLEVGSRRALMWSASDGSSLADLLDVDGSAQVLVTPTFRACARLDTFAGVRLLRLAAPSTSLLYTSPLAQQRLADSPFWFGTGR